MRRRAKVALSITGGVLALAITGAGVLAYLNRPLSRAEFDLAVEERLRSAVENDPTLSSALLTVYSGPDDRLLQYAVGTTGPKTNEAATVDSRYHSASVGKTMLAAIYGQLVDEQRLTFDDPISTWLDASTLDGLFMLHGVDHSGDVTVGQLLSHTSGVADYFEGPVTSGTPLLQQVTDDPDTSFTPESLLAFSRERQVPVGAPGAQFAYSDTGYILLGLALESIEHKPYAQILEERLFAPLGMSDSELMTRFGDDTGILPITLDGVDLSTRAALSFDWAGGGVVTTMADLFAFMRALNAGDIVSAEVLAELADFSHEMGSGIRYGMGMMQFRFAELSPLLFGMTDAHGAVGATGTFALYDPSSDMHFIANFGSLDFQQKAIEVLVDIRLLVDRLRE